MFSSHDLLVDVLVREREREGEKAAALHALLRGAYEERTRRHSLRARLGFSLIQAGRTLLRRRPAYATASRRPA